MRYEYYEGLDYFFEENREVGINPEPSDSTLASTLKVVARIFVSLLLPLYATFAVIYRSGLCILHLSSALIAYFQKRPIQELTYDQHSKQFNEELLLLIKEILSPFISIVYIPFPVKAKNLNERLNFNIKKRSISL